MSKRELAAKYGEKQNTAKLINRAIRTELTGGPELLDLLDWLHKHPSLIDAPDGRELLSQLRAISDAMAGEIRRRYGMENKELQP
jgi:hypothetical protein